MIKVVFFDIDGTLMYDKKISDTTRQAIDLLKQNGVLPVLATGRCEFEVAPIREQLGIDYAITCNGGHIGNSGQTIRGNALPPKLLAAWFDSLTDDHTLLLYGAEKMYITRPNCPYFLQARQEIGFAEPIPVSSAKELPSIYQVILFCPEEAAALYTDDHGDDLYQHRWRTWAIDLNAKGTNKSVGIARLLDHLGFSKDEAAALGDGRNDIEMIQYVGRGIAMGNACEELLACAPHTTLHAKDDGILHAVENLILCK